MEYTTVIYTKGQQSGSCIFKSSEVKRIKMFIKKKEKQGYVCETI